GVVPRGIRDALISVPRPAAQRDRRHPCEGLDVVQQRRPLVQTLGLDQRRAITRLGAMLLDRLDQRRLLAADIAAGALEDLQLERLAGPHDIGPDDPQLPRPADLRLDGADLVEVFMPDVDVTSMSPDDPRAHDHPLPPPLN